MLNIFLIDDHPMFRAGVKALIEAETAHKIWEFEDAKTALAKTTEIKPDLIFLDIELPDTSGLSVITELKMNAPMCRIIVLSSHNQSLYIQHAKSHGAAGYLLKDDEPKSILKCLRLSNDDTFYLSPKCRESESQRSRGLESKRISIEELTHREKEVIFLISKDMTSKEIGAYLSVSYRTIQNHRANIKSKLGLLRNSQLMKVSISWKPELERLFG